MTVTAHTSGGGDVATLRRALTAAEKRFRGQDKKLRAAFDDLRTSIGKDKHPVLVELRAFHAVIETEIHALEHHNVHSSSAEHARNLAIETLTVLAAGLAALRRAVAAHDPATAKHALRQSKHLLKHGETLSAQASTALGFRWRP